MKKISTLYKKDPSDLSRVIDELNEENRWVIDGGGIATIKRDGTAVAVIEGELYKRYDCRLIKKKRGKVIKLTQEEAAKKLPIGAIACQEPDLKSGHWPHWVKCDRGNPEDKYHFMAFDKGFTIADGTYELCGEKIQGNPENVKGYELLRHGAEVFKIEDLSFDGLREFLSQHDIEGIVFHHKTDGRMCKIRKVDFGLKR